MIIDVYADVVCPWCYIGSRRLEGAIALRPDLPVERRWRPFQLQPHMPAGACPGRSSPGGSSAARRTRKPPSRR